jgi:hypothetical protein
MKFDRLINSGASGGSQPSSPRACSVSVRPVGRRFLFAFAAIVCASIVASAGAARMPLNFRPNPVNTKDPFNLGARHFQLFTASITTETGTPLGSDSESHFFNDGVQIGTTLTPLPALQALFPIISLFAAVAFAHLLRRSARLEALVKIER